ncbi:MAG: sensor histidine kinase [Acidimicrobiia bacterium]
MRLALGAATLVVLGVGVFSVVMQPTTAERVGIGLIFGLMAIGAAVAAVWLPRLAENNRSLRTTVIALSVVSFLIVAVGMVAAGQQMFISPHDLTVLLIVVGFGVVAAAAFAVLVSGPLTGDLTLIAESASGIASGDLTKRTRITRSDEVGDLAAAIDGMALVLQEAERIRTRDDAVRREFFAAVGHDLRTPLASMQAALEALQDGLVDDPDRYLGSMRKDTAALAQMVEDLFLLARLESGAVELDVESIDLTEIADEAVEVFRPLAASKALTMVLEFDERVTALAAPEGVARVVRNLLDNAVRHSPAGGEVVVSVSNGTSAQVVITDDGEGFEDAFVEHAFEPFSRNDDVRRRATGGAGLGLAIAHDYVSGFGGEIWAEPGPGGKVGFRLPVV